MSKYEDIIGRKPPELRHPRMPRQDRAKLFAPFAALNGHGQALRAREQADCTGADVITYGQNPLYEDF